MKTNITIKFTKDDIINLIRTEVESRGFKINEDSLRTIEGQMGEFLGVELNADFIFDNRLYTGGNV